MSRQLKPCGTPAAYQRHRSRGEEPCAACKRANSQETRRYNWGTAEAAAMSRRRAAARMRALARLKADHLQEYRRYYAEEMRRSERGEAS